MKKYHSPKKLRTAALDNCEVASKAVPIWFLLLQNVYDNTDKIEPNKK